MGFGDFTKGLRMRSDGDGNASTAAAAVGPAPAPNLTPLALACKRSDFETALALLEGGADPNETSGDGRTPLFFCSDVALVSMLVHFGADLDFADDDGDTPFMVYLRGENSN